MKLLLLGATGLVGSCTLQLALSRAAITGVVAPTRRALAPHAKLTNPVGALEQLIPSLLSYRPDAIICALGTTQKKAGSSAAFRQVDHDLPVAVARAAAHAAGTGTYAIVTAAGASVNSRFFYYRTKGEVERDLQAIGLRSLTICRPNLIGGERSETRPAERAGLWVLGLLAPILPRRLRINDAAVIASALLEAVIDARPGCRTIAPDDMH